MKKFFTLALIVIGFYVSASAQTAPTATTTTAPTAKVEKVKHSKKHTKMHNVKTAATLYECPMKCEKASATAGKCAKCGMDKVALK